ncbi:hypothetical protein [Paenibacillus odorifer]|uniref:hypothetical protein n=1 Tax=Paenibacillus odorifer TaxID=189426 RepID=UPI0011802797|nr:hypothetical protein [Paenibacillus odorifer]
MNSPLPKLVFLTESSDVAPWARVRTPVALLLGREFGLQYRYSLGTGSGSDSSDVTPWAPVRTPVTLLLGRGFGLQ